MTWLRCSEHSKPYRYFCPTHCCVICPLCTYSHNRCHIIELDEDLDGPYYAGMFTSVNETIDDKLQKLRQHIENVSLNIENNVKVDSSRGNQNYEPVNALLSNIRNMMTNLELAIINQNIRINAIKPAKIKLIYIVTFRNLLTTLEKYMSTQTTTPSQESDFTQKTNQAIRHYLQTFQEFRPNNFAIEVLTSIPSGQIELVLIKKLRVSSEDTSTSISSCFFTSNKKMAFLDVKHKSLIIHDRYGSFERCIKLYGQPWDATAAGQNSVVIRYHGWNWFEVLDISGENSGNVVTSKILRRVSFKNEIVFSSNDTSVLDVYRPNGAIVTSVPEDFETVFANIACDKTKIYYIGKDRKTVFWIQKDGKRCQDFVFHGDTSMKNSLATTGNGYIFVAMEGENGLLAVNCDLKYKQLFTVKDAEMTSNISSVSFDRQNSRLLLCSWQGDGLLYDVRFPFAY